jgi:hypothetical protein
MRFSGQNVDFDPCSLPYGLGDRFAGDVAVQNPELVDRIKATVLPNSDQSQFDGFSTEQAS